MLKRLFTREATSGVASAEPFVRNPWQEYLPLKKLPLPSIAPESLVNMATFRLEERMHASGHVDPLEIFVAYAQERYAYDKRGSIYDAHDEYSFLPTDKRVNKFGLAYRPEAKLLLHETLAAIVVDAAIDMYKNQKWKLRLYDGLRTMEGAFWLYAYAQDQWLRDGLLAAPGESAHNRAMAVDSMLVLENGAEVDMGARFDCSDMKINSRNYTGKKISAMAQHNRLVRERAFLRAAIKNSTVIAPLRAEFWDDRFPGADADLWRVLESLARASNQPLPPEENRATDYESFCKQWRALNLKGELVSLFGPRAAEPPAYEKIIFHEKLRPIFDADLPPEFRQTERNPASA